MGYEGIVVDPAFSKISRHFCVFQLFAFKDIMIHLRQLNVNFDAVSSQCANFDEVQYFKTYT